MKARTKWILGIAAASFVLAPLAVVFNYEWETESRLNAARNQWKAMGLPLSQSEFGASMSEGAHEVNATYDRLAIAWRASPDAKVLVANKSRTQVYAALNRLKPLLDQVETMALDKSFRLRPTQVFVRPECRSWALALQARALRDLEQNRPEDALRGVRTIFCLARLLYTEPSLITTLNAYLVQAIGREPFLKTAARGDLAWRRRVRTEALAFYPERRLEPILSQSFLETQGMDLRRANIIVETDHPHRATAWHIKNLALLRPVQNRARAIHAEVSVFCAQLLEDGAFTDAEHKAFETRKASLSAEPGAGDIAQRLVFFMPEMFTTERVRAEKDFFVAVLDVLVEQAGGPRAKLPRGITVTTTGAETRVVSSNQATSYVMRGSTVEAGR